MNKEFEYRFSSPVPLSPKQKLVIMAASSGGELMTFFENNQLDEMMTEVIEKCVTVSIAELRSWIQPRGFIPEADFYKVLAQICHIKKPSMKALGKQYNFANASANKVQGKSQTMDKDGRILLLR